MRDRTFLSCRERQLVSLVLQGKRNKEIAFELHLTIGTVKEYMHRLFRKINVSSRVELAIWAINGGVLKTPDHVALAVWQQNGGILDAPNAR